MEHCFASIKRHQYLDRLQQLTSVHPEIAAMQARSSAPVTSAFGKGSFAGSEAAAKEVADVDKDLKKVTGILKNLELPFSLNITHFEDKRWATTMGSGDVQARLSAGMASQLTARVDKEMLGCVLRMAPIADAEVSVAPCCVER